MNPKNMLNKCTPFLFSVLTGLSGAVNAEEFNLDSFAQTVQSEEKSVSGLKPTEVQGSLTETLVKTLGITNEQAQGGAGALFQLAKSQLDAGQFAELSKAVPGMDSLLSKVPKQAEISSNLLASEVVSVSSDNDAYGNLSALGTVFKDLNLSPDMVDQFVPIVVDYVRTNGGDLTANRLQSAFYSGS